MIKTVFYLTAQALDKTAKCLHLTYNEVEIQACGRRIETTL